jgi:hypothetical protein
LRNISYKKNVKDTILVPGVIVSEGNEYNGKPIGVNVFQVVRDIFVLNFIEEDGKMKVLVMVIGN